MEGQINLIRCGKWSICFKKNNQFYKEYIYPNPQAIKREELASKTVWSLGLYTPKFIATIIQEGKTYSLFEYHDIKSINPNLIQSNPSFALQIIKILNLLEEVEWDHEDMYWYKQMEDFENALSYVGKDTHELSTFLKNLKPTNFIHGDFTCDNIGVISERLIVYDFQHGSLGPKGWDKAYLASTFLPNKCGFLCLDSTELMMAYAISAIRYGRGLRKSSLDLVERKKQYELWKLFLTS